MSDDTETIDVETNSSVESPPDTDARRDDIEADIRAAMQPSEPERPADTDEAATTEAAALEEPPSDQPTDGPQPPSSWKKELQARWSEVPPEVQAEVLRREGEISAKLAEGSTLGRVMEPYRAQIEQAGLTIDQYVGNVMQNVVALRQHPLQALAHLANQYLDAQSARQLGSYLLGDEYDHSEEVGSQARGPDPHTQAQLQQIQTQLALQEYERFKGAKDEAGKPIYPHVDDVRQEMMAELRIDPNLSYEAAYQRAIWRNEQIRQKLLDQEVEKRKAATKAKAEAAKARTLPKGSSNELPEFVHASDDVGADILRAWRQLGGG